MLPVFNLLTPMHKKVIHTLTKLLLSAADLLKFVENVFEHQELGRRWYKGIDWSDEFVFFGFFQKY